MGPLSMYTTDRNLGRFKFSIQIFDRNLRLRWVDSRASSLKGRWRLARRRATKIWFQSMTMMQRWRRRANRTVVSPSLQVRAEIRQKKFFLSNIFKAAVKFLGNVLNKELIKFRRRGELVITSTQLHQIILLFNIIEIFNKLQKYSSSIV